MEQDTTDWIMVRHFVLSNDTVFFVNHRPFDALLYARIFINHTIKDEKLCSGSDAYE